MIRRNYKFERSLVKTIWQHKCCCRKGSDRFKNQSDTALPNRVLRALIVENLLCYVSNMHCEKEIYRFEEATAGRELIAIGIEERLERGELLGKIL